MLQITYGSTQEWFISPSNFHLFSIIFINIQRQKNDKINGLYLLPLCSDWINYYTCKLFSIISFTTWIVVVERTRVSNVTKEFPPAENLAGIFLAEKDISCSFLTELNIAEISLITLSQRYDLFMSWYVRCLLLKLHVSNICIFGMLEAARNLPLPSPTSPSQKVAV